MTDVATRIEATNVFLALRESAREDAHHFIHVLNRLGGSATQRAILNGGPFTSSQWDTVLRNARTAITISGGHITWHDDPQTGVRYYTLEATQDQFDSWVDWNDKYMTTRARTTRFMRNSDTVRP